MVASPVADTGRGGGTVPEWMATAAGESYGVSGTKVNDWCWCCWIGCSVIAEGCVLLDDADECRREVPGSLRELLLPLPSRL